MNNSPDHHKTVAATSQGTFRSKGSRFHSYLSPVDCKETIQKTLQEIRIAHPKANHICLTYRLGIDPTEEYQSDDREPAGSAGMPILRTLQSAELVNCMLVVVRYFGGTKLGVPGLIQSYREAAQNSINEARIIHKIHMSHIKAECRYEHLNELYRLVGQYDGRIMISESGNDPVSLMLELPSSELSGFLKELGKTYPLNKKLRIIKD